MDSTKENPLLFFDYYLKQGIHSDLKKFYLEGINELSQEIDKIDRDNHRILDKDGSYYSFEQSIKNKLNLQLDKTNSLIEERLIEDYSSSSKVEALGKFIEKKISLLYEFEAFSTFPFLNGLFRRVEELIEKHKCTPKLDRNHSFNLIPPQNETKEAFAKKLLSILREAQFVECEDKEFINAFTGKSVNDGVKWTLLSKSKRPNFKSLFYFIDLLVQHEFLKDSATTSWVKNVEYIFRDLNNNRLKNMRQSKDRYIHREGAEEYPEIYDIIASLKKL